MGESGQKKERAMQLCLDVAKSGQKKEENAEKQERKVVHQAYKRQNVSRTRGE